MAVYVRCNICGKIIDTETEEYQENLVGEFICDKCNLKGYKWKEAVNEQCSFNRTSC